MNDDSESEEPTNGVHPEEHIKTIPIKQFQPLSTNEYGFFLNLLVSLWYMIHIALFLSWSYFTPPSLKALDHLSNLQTWGLFLQANVVFFFVISIIDRKLNNVSWESWVLENRWNKVLIYWAIPAVAIQIPLVGLLLNEYGNVLQHGIKLPILSIPIWPIILLLWYLRDKNKESELQNSTYDRLQLDFHKLEEWASTSSNNNISKSLRVTSIYQLKRYLNGDILGKNKDSNPFQVPTQVLFQSILNSCREQKTQTGKTLYYIKDYYEIIEAIKEIIFESVNSVAFPSLYFPGIELRGKEIVNAFLVDATLTNVDLRLANLLNSDLSGVNLSYADLSGATLSNVTLKYSKLPQATMSHAILRECSLYQTKMAKLLAYKTKIEKANMQKSTLSKSKLQYATLIDVNLESADLSGADLSNSTLERVNLSKANLTNANFRNTTLKDVILSKATLANTDFTFAKISQVDLEKSDLQEAIFTNSILSDVTLTNTNLNKANFNLSKLKNVYLNDADLLGSNFTNADLTNPYLMGIRNWRSAQWHRTTIYGVTEEFEGRINNTYQSKNRMDVPNLIDKEKPNVPIGFLKFVNEKGGKVDSGLSM